MEWDFVKYSKFCYKRTDKWKTLLIVHWLLCFVFVVWPLFWLGATIPVFARCLPQLYSHLHPWIKLYPDLGTISAHRVLIHLQWSLCKLVASRGVLPHQYQWGGLHWLKKRKWDARFANITTYHLVLACLDTNDASIPMMHPSTYF